NHKSFIPKDGEYTINATAYGDRNAIDPGITKQVTLILTANPLPVEIVKFDVRTKGSELTFIWQTASEINNSHFEIFQGNSIEDFEKIAMVPKSNANTSLKSYSYTTNTIACGRQFFQLRNIDYDGHIDYSKIVTTNINSRDCDLSYYPNPVDQNKLFVNHKQLDAGSEIKITSIDGRVVKTVILSQATEGPIEIDVSDLKEGVYLLSVSSNLNLKTERLIISR
ncbi:T9SS type A sorting domain-containing protein, partial [Fulvivirga sp. RKSG066]|uniref:T9SS type A sorting domain-containing protein n=1 Tax=Fulvivirga aurantia TaxID=2529383 RepID=UPI0012BC0889